jgi:uncharacterized RDD family membrane protein YckC
VAAPNHSHSEYAGLVSRVVCLGVDVVLLTAVGLAVAALPSVAYNVVVGRSPTWLSVSSGIVASLLPWAYFTACWRLGGKTAGGLLVGIAVRRPDGSLVGLTQAALRAFLGLLFAPLWIVGLLGILWDGRRRAWHDRAFGTVLRYTPSVQQPAER